MPSTRPRERSWSLPSSVHTQEVQKHGIAGELVATPPTAHAQRSLNGSQVGRIVWDASSSVIQIGRNPRPLLDDQLRRYLDERKDR